MIRIRIRDGQDEPLFHISSDGITQGIASTHDIFLAEELYFRGIRYRSNGPGALTISGSSTITPAIYHADMGWRGWREEHPERYAQIWGESPHPTVAQVRGLMRANGLTGRQLADLIGTDDRIVRRWASDEDDRKIPSAAWRYALERLGYLKMVES